MLKMIYSKIHDNMIQDGGNLSSEVGILNIETISLLESLADNMLFFIEDILLKINEMELVDDKPKKLLQSIEAIVLITSNLGKIISLKQSPFDNCTNLCSSNSILLKVYSYISQPTQCKIFNNINILVANNYCRNDTFYGEPEIISMILTLLIRSSFLQNKNINVYIQSKISANIVCFEIITEGVELSDSEKHELKAIFGENSDTNILISEKTFIWQIVVNLLIQTGYRLKVLLGLNYFLGFTLFTPSQNNN
jgi:hypothetical protein